jgi:hypothetical protein
MTDTSVILDPLDAFTALRMFANTYGGSAS